MKIKRSFFVACILCSIHLNTLAQKNWREVVSVEQVCEYYPEVVKRMLNQFDLDHEGLEKVKAANDRSGIFGQGLQKQNLTILSQSKTKRTDYYFSEILGRP